MRPHRLRVTAFGAFGGTVEVSFDELASSGLFLLHGETGAGKTTLLDAIGFALYGRVPGERGKARRLRSDHAVPGTATEVQLEATLGGRRMRITRKPEQERPKRRGAGTTTEQAKVLLEELTGASWQAVSTRAGEADTEIADLMGMSADQFFQVVLLPQGEFAKFLHADAGDRAKLLQRLFGTDRFRKVEDWLADRRRVTARAVEEAEAGITAHLARVTQAAGLEDSDNPETSSEPQSASAPSLPGSRLPSATWAAQLAETAAGEAVASASQVTSYRGDLDRALDLLRETERLADRQRRRQAALRTRDDLARAEASVRERRGELAAAARAAEVAPALAEAERTAAVLAQARAAEERARTAADAEPGAGAAALRDGGRAAHDEVRPAGGSALGVPAGGRRGPGRRRGQDRRGRADRPDRRREPGPRRQAAAAPRAAAASATRPPRRASAGPPSGLRPTATAEPPTTQAPWSRPWPTRAVRSGPGAPRSLTRPS